MQYQKVLRPLMLVGGHACVDMGSEDPHKYDIKIELFGVIKWIGCGNYFKYSIV